MAKPKRYTAEQITRILKQQEAGVKVAEICRQATISEQTFYRWKSKYGGMGASDIHRLKALEQENQRLKQLLGDAMLDNQALKAALDQKY
jgi:putative transposase